MGYFAENFPERFEYHDVTCDQCGIELKSAIDPEEKVWRSLQPDDGLVINLSGGYGMAIDPFGGEHENLKILLCKDCTIKLCQQFSAFSRIVEKYCSSSLGHSCSKEEKFVWKPVGQCCAGYCAKCFREGTYFVGLSDENDQFSRRIINCIHGCEFIGPALWGFEGNSIWGAHKWNPETKKSELLKKFMLQSEAEAFLVELEKENPNSEYSDEKYLIPFKIEVDK